MIGLCCRTQPSRKEATNDLRAIHSLSHFSTYCKDICAKYGESGKYSFHLQGRGRLRRLHDEMVGAMHPVEHFHISHSSNRCHHLRRHEPHILCVCDDECGQKCRPWHWDKRSAILWRHLGNQNMKVNKRWWWVVVGGVGRCAGVEPDHSTTTTALLPLRNLNRYCYDMIFCALHGEY